MRALGVLERPAVGGLTANIDWVAPPLPSPGPREVRVRVMASTINIDDQHLAEGTMFGGFPVSPRPKRMAPVIPGVDIAGVIDAVGDRVNTFAKGDRVFGIVSPTRREGSWAEYCVVSASNLHHLPSDRGFADGAALGLASMVVCALMEAAGDVRGTRCVVVGASGGIGGLTTRVLAASGAEVWGVASSANAERVRGFGAVEVVDYHEDPFGVQLQRRGVRVDRVVDCVGGLDIERQALLVLHRGGRFLTICGPERYVGERRLGAFGLARMVAYLVWRSVSSLVRGPRYQIVGPTTPDWPAIERFVLEPGIAPAIDRVVPFERRAVRHAIAYVASHRARGKVVITFSP